MSLLRPSGAHMRCSRSELAEVECQAMRLAFNLSFFLRLGVRLHRSPERNFGGEVVHVRPIPELDCPASPPLLGRFK